MTIPMLVQVSFDLLLVVVLVMVWARLHRKSQDDPRLSRGLQILQSKIAILEDLSDKTEVQVGQLTSILEQKKGEVQRTLMEVESKLNQINQSITKSLEVAKIFQDKIPHEEIIERQKMAKYVKAATLAHKGVSNSQIAKSVDLAREEIDFIVKVNKNELMFAPEDLPSWAKSEDHQDHIMESEAAVKTEEASLNLRSEPAKGGLTHSTTGVHPNPKGQGEIVRRLGIEPVTFRNLDLERR